MKLRVLHLDDDLFEHTRVAMELSTKVAPCTFEVESFASAGDLLKRASENPPDIALIDIYLDQSHAKQGLEIAKALQAMDPRILVVALSFDMGLAHEALMAGAHDFIAKKAQPGELGLRLYCSHQLHTGWQETAARTDGKKQLGETLSSVARRVERIRDSAIMAIHVVGESGTGKEMVANLLQDCLPKGTPFVRVNCAAISPYLLESELFGHKKGAFTGAMIDRIGYLEAAHRGWIFLDEIGCLSTSAQAALLRVLESKEIIRVGDHVAREIDVRVISATNIALADEVAKGRFRGDLWQRLNEAVIQLPPLRERMSEIDVLVDHFCQTERGGPYEVSPEARAILKLLSWSAGNVRQLRNCLRSMTERRVGKTLLPMSLPDWVWDELTPADSNGKGVITAPNQLVIDLTRDKSLVFSRLSDLLLVEILRKLRQADPKLSLGTAAQAMGMPKSTLVSKLRKVVELGYAPESELKTFFGKSEPT